MRHLFSSVRHLFSTLSYSLHYRHGRRCRGHWFSFSCSFEPQVANDIIDTYKLEKDVAVSILFFARNGTRDNFFELFAKVFRSFPPRRNFFDGPKIFQNLADSAAIRLVQKSSKSEPSSPFFGRLKFRESLSRTSSFKIFYADAK